MKHFKYYVPPPLEAYASTDSDYAQGFKTYAEYNYLRPGLASSLKARHFEAALKLTKEYFHTCNVIDFGCADGVFLPSLSRHFNHVAAVDRNHVFVRNAAKLVETLRLDNVQVLCNESMTPGEMRSRRIEGEQYHIMYLLEVLEHIAARGALYKTKIHFLKEAASLLDEDGLLVISVPKMIGIPFLLQRIGLAFFGLEREPLSLKNLLKAALLNDTVDLEKNWQGEYAHLGFNHRKLERRLAKEFRIVKKKHLLFQVVYVIKKIEKRTPAPAHPRGRASVTTGDWPVISDND